MQALQAASQGSPTFPKSYQDLTRPEKAAIIVQALIDADAEFSLESLPDRMQTNITRDLARMPAVDRGTLDMVIEEFLEEVSNLGLAFPSSLEESLSRLEGKLSPTTLARLKREQGMQASTDPWERIADMSIDSIFPFVEDESPEVAAVIASKLPVNISAKILERLPGPRARTIAYAVSQTSGISPQAVDRIGHALLSQLDGIPEQVFDDAPVARVSAILNSSTSKSRENLLEGLEESDQAFASEVRKAIFTFGNIPSRVAPRDVPKIVKEIDADTLTAALAAARVVEEEEAVDFLLENISQRMADQIRETMSELDPVTPEVAEGMMAPVTEAVRNLESSGQISFMSTS
ncbi:MAG: FliG C-terminal domain-containing protein [Pseudomonadota bacterium]